MTNDNDTTRRILPNSVPVSDVQYNERTSVTMVTKYGDVLCSAMAVNDTLVNAELVYRGNTYRLSYEHCDDQGNLFVWGQGGNDRHVLDADSAFDMYRAREAFKPGAPKTYIGPLLDAVGDAVRRYLATCTAQVRTNRFAQLRQSQHRAAERYNEAAAKAAEALEAWETVTKAIESVLEGQ